MGNLQRAALRHKFPFSMEDHFENRLIFFSFSSKRFVSGPYTAAYNKKVSVKLKRPIRLTFKRHEHSVFLLQRLTIYRVKSGTYNLAKARFSRALRLFAETESPSSPKPPPPVAVFMGGAHIEPSKSKQKRFTRAFDKCLRFFGRAKENGMVSGIRDSTRRTRIASIH